MRTLFPGARLGICLRHAFLKFPKKLMLIASPVRQVLRSQFHPWLYRTRQRQGLRVFALGHVNVLPPTSSPEWFLPRATYLWLFPDECPRGHSGDDAERHIDQQEVRGEHRPTLPQPEAPRTAHRQKDQKQSAITGAKK
jgi:hypothetical protein